MCQSNIFVYVGHRESTVVSVSLKVTFLKYKILKVTLNYIDQVFVQEVTPGPI